jgi:hypothetical protein
MNRKLHQTSLSFSLPLTIKMSECYMVLLSSEDYVVGVLTLWHSLRLVDATRPLV